MEKQRWLLKNAFKGGVGVVRIAIAIGNSLKSYLVE
jgi:hypothetical protein